MQTTLSNGRPGIRAPLQVDIFSPHLLRKDELPPLSEQPARLLDGPDRNLDLGLAGARPSQKEQPAGPAAGSLPILDFIASDESLDRFGEIICAAGWRLDTYRRNPVFQNAHQYGDILFTLGKALVTEVRIGNPTSGTAGQLSSPPAPVTAPYLFQRVQFATDVNPVARVAYGLYRGKFLRAVSVGFIPLRWEDQPGQAGGGAARGRARRRYLEQELLEVSAVGIPANPNALALGLKAGAIDKADLREVLELLRSLSARSGDRGGRPGTAPGRGVALPRQELLLFARELHGLLRRA